MLRLDMPKAIERIIVLHPDGAMTIHRSRKNRRRGSKLLKPYAKYARTQARANAVQADTLLGRLRRSDEKKKDGWAKDHIKNSMKANKASNKVWRRAYL